MLLIIQTLSLNSQWNNMSASIIIKLLLVINSLIICGAEDLGNQLCKPEGTTWEENGTQYKSLIYRNELHAYAICKVGFKLSSGSKVRCVNGLWEYPLPLCERIVSRQCEPLPNLQIVIKKCDEIAPSVGSVCRFRCPSKYSLMGSSERFCNVKLQWTGNQPQCILNKVRANPAPEFDYVRYKYNQGREDISKNNNILKNCNINNGGCEQVCTLSRGFPVCSCREGYRLLGEGKCQDVNECQEQRHQCSYHCINTPGSYKCECPFGYAVKNKYHCEDVDECQEQIHDCSHRCINTPGNYKCECPLGFVVKNKYHCKDVDECKEQTHQCSHRCINTPGSYKCECYDGYVVKNKYHCEDIDECRFSLTNRCNQKCSNTPGSYVCSCESGYILKNSHECEGCRKNSYKSETQNICIECPSNSVTDSKAKTSIADCYCLPGFIGTPFNNVPCSDINECLTNNFGCSHFCINTPGSAICSCPLGFELKDDNKTCVDVDECQIKNGGCEMFCHNSPGSFSCSCSNGYTLAENNYFCIDNDECADGNNGGCSDICNNFPGGYYCSCRKGFRLDVEGKTCSSARCLSVAVPHHSSLRCKVVNKTKIISKPHDYSLQNPHDYPFGTSCRVKCSRGYKVTTPYEVIECLEDGSWNATTPQCIASHCTSLKIPENGDVYPPICKEEFIPVLQKCYFTCKPGYEINSGKNMVKCKNNITWTNDPPSCTAVHRAPSIVCPDDIKVDLGWNESSTNVYIPEPITNMEGVEVYPDRIRLEQFISFPSGKTNVLFKVRNFDSNMTSQCIMTINVIDKQPPIFMMCPESFSVNDADYRGVLVTWDEPVAIDNVGIQSIDGNLEPNSILSAGVHFVEYTAKDAAGNNATCEFQINITRGHCNDLNDPENGKAICSDWLMGRLCRPICNPGFLRDPDEPKFFACGDGRWTPTHIISPCLPNCLNGTVWSTISQSCEEEAFNNS